MKWLEIWAKLQVFGIIFGIVLTVIVGIIYLIMWIGGNKK